MAAVCHRWILAVCLVLSAPFVFGEEIDRLIVAVNGKVITEGDLDLARSLNEIIFYDKSTQPNSSGNEIDKLVDLELMRRELATFSITEEDESRVEERMQSLRDVYAGKAGLPLLLQKLGLQESELIAHLQFESSMMRFVDFRFRPFVKVSEEEIKAYYDGKLAEQLRKAKVTLPPLAQVSGRIEEILREEKINTMLEQWMKEIRNSSRIEYFDSADDFKTAPGESSDR